MPKGNGETRRWMSLQYPLIDGCSNSGKRYSAFPRQARTITTRSVLVFGVSKRDPPFLYRWKGHNLMPPFYNYFISFMNLEVSYSSTSLTVIKNERLRSIFFTLIRNPQLQDALSGGEAKIPKSKSSLICNQGLELACSCTNSTASNLEQYSNIQGKLEKSCTHLALLTYI